MPMATHPPETAKPETCYRHPGQETLVHCTRCGRPICPECMTPAPVGHHCPACVTEARRSAPRRPIRLRRPRSVTIVLLAVNVAVFAFSFLLSIGGGRTETLVRLGAMVPILVADGQFWRLVTAIFLHVNIVHLLLNSLGLAIFGNLVESVIGGGRMLAVYLVSGFVASAVSFAFGSVNSIAVGASGAIFGLLGTWLAYNLRRRQLSLARANVQGALLLIALNLVIGFSIPGVDNLAHVGGLVAGIIGGFAVDGFGRRGIRTASRIVGLVMLFLAGVALTAWRVAELRAAVS
jgi:membrane associated rhomboid family serine protease